MKSFVSVAKANFGSVEKMLESLNIEVAAKYDKSIFLDEVIKELSIDAEVGEIIYSKLQRNDFCSVASFVDFAHTFDPSHSSRKDASGDKVDVNGLVSALEKRYALLEVFNNLAFDDKGSL